jgi:hypothetical protein
VTDTWVIQEDELNFEQIFLSGTSSTVATSQHHTVSEDDTASNNADTQINVPDKMLMNKVQIQLPHVRSRQNGNKAVQCPQCGKGYSNNGNLMRHLKFECGKEPQFHCPLCPLRTRHKSNLLSHMYCKHPASYQKM